MAAAQDEPDKVLAKVYVLDDSEEWREECMGNLLFYEIELTESGRSAFKLIIADENDHENVLQEWDVSAQTEYSRQEDTLITWSESNKRIALSFETSRICEICFDTIQKAFKILVSYEDEENEENSELTESRLEELDSLPEFTYGNLPELAALFAEAQNNMHKKEQLILLVEKKNGVSKCIEIFKAAESLKDWESLGNLFIIVKSIFSMPKFSIFESLLSEENIYHVLGILEYNPALAETVKHREILDSSKFLELIPFSSENLQKMVKHTHSLQYIRDLIAPIPCVFEERASFVMSFLVFRRNEVLDHLFDDKIFLTKFFSLLTEEETEQSLITNLLRFLVELCSFTPAMQIEQKEILISRMLSYDLIGAIDTIKSKIPKECIHHAIEILLRISETHPDALRRYMAQINNKENDLALFLCQEALYNPHDNRFHSVIQLIKSIIDVSNSSLKEEIKKTETDAFLTVFYSSPIKILMTPVFQYSLNTPLIETSFENSLIIENVLSIAVDCTTFHSFFIKNYFFKSDILKNIVSLVGSKYAHVAHSAVSVIRRCLACSDQFYNKYLDEECILDKIFELLIKRYTRYDIMNSAIIELFDFLRISNNRSLCQSFVNRNRANFENVTYTQVFRKLVVFVDSYINDRESKIRAPFLVKPSSLFQSIRLSPLKRKSPENNDDWFESYDGESDENENKEGKITEDSWDFKPLIPKILDQSADDGVVIRPAISKPSITISLRSNSILSTINEDDQKIPSLPLVSYSDDDEEENKIVNSSRLQKNCSVINESIPDTAKAIDNF